MSGAELMPAGVEPLHTELRALIAASRQRLASAVNAELTRLYWTVGQLLSTEILGGERAAYGSQLINQLGERLAQEFGRGFETKKLRRMVQFAQIFPDSSIVATLSRQLSWSHIVALLPLKSDVCLHRTVDRRLRVEVLGGEWASYGSQMLERLRQKLSQEFVALLRSPQPALLGEFRPGASRPRDFVDTVDTVEIPPNPPFSKGGATPQPEPLAPLSPAIPPFEKGGLGGICKTSTGDEA